MEAVNWAIKFDLISIVITFLKASNFFPTCCMSPHQASDIFKLAIEFIIPDLFEFSRTPKGKYKEYFNWQQNKNILIKCISIIQVQIKIQFFFRFQSDKRDLFHLFPGNQTRKCEWNSTQMKILTVFHAIVINRKL